MLKRLERAWRRMLIGALVGGLPRPAGGPPDWSAGGKRVLFLRHDRAGDMIVSTGVMRAIACSPSLTASTSTSSPENVSSITR